MGEGRWEMGDGRKARQDVMDLFGKGVVHHSQAMQQILGETPLARPACSAPAMLCVSQIWVKWRQKGQNPVENGKEGRVGAKGKRLLEH